MKIALLTAGVLIGGATAFAPRPILVKQSISLQISSTPGDFRRENGYFEPKKDSKLVKKATTIKPGNWLQRKSMDDVIIDPDYYLTWCFAIVGAVITWYHPGEFIVYPHSLATELHHKNPQRSLFGCSQWFANDF